RWDVARGMRGEKNSENCPRSIEAVVEKKREPLFDAEHFFDGWKADRDYAFACIKTASEPRAKWIVLCDTNGGIMPEEAYGIVSAVKDRLPEAPLGIHAH